MLKIQTIGCSLLIAGLVAASPAHAHFKLLKPDSWLMEGDDGAPQKGGPCGPGGYDDNGAAQTNKVTTFHAGDEIALEWEITVPHTGFFQVSVAKDRSELMDPALGEDGLCNYSTPPAEPPAYPVLATNIDSGSTSTMVKLPEDLTCEKCTLQVIMWMTNHPPGCIYYHCADIKILPAGATAADAGMGSAGTSGSGGAAAPGTGGMGAAGVPGTGGSGMMPAQGGSTGSGGSKGTTGTGGSSSVAGGSGGSAASTGSGGVQGTGGTMAGPTMTPASSSKSGCNVARPGAESSSAFTYLAGALGLGGVATRIRRRRTQR